MATVPDWLPKELAHDLDQELLAEGRLMSPAILARLLGCEVREARRYYPQEKPAGYVYFVLASGYDRGPMVKIGWAKDPDRRLAAIQCHNPSDLDLLAVIPAEPDYERELHERFSEQRLRGEWFRFDDEIAEFLESLEGPS